MSDGQDEHETSELAQQEDERHTMELWRGEVNSNLRDMTKTLQEVVIEVKQRPTRAEIEMMLSQKVNLDIFQTEVQSLREQHAHDLKVVQEDIIAIRSSPGKVRDWLSTGISAGVGCLSLCLAGLSLLLSVLIATHVIH